MRTDGDESREKILNAIADYIEDHKYPPSMRELCEITGLRSTNTINRHITKLLVSGDLETDHEPGTPRALRLSENAKKRLANSEV